MSGIWTSESVNRDTTRPCRKGSVDVEHSFGTSTPRLYYRLHRDDKKENFLINKLRVLEKGLPGNLLLQYSVSVSRPWWQVRQVRRICQGTRTSTQSDENYCRVLKGVYLSLPGLHYTSQDQRSTPDEPFSDVSTYVRDGFFFFTHIHRHNRVLLDQCNYIHLEKVKLYQKNFGCRGGRCRDIKSREVVV